MLFCNLEFKNLEFRISLNDFMIYLADKQLWIEDGAMKKLYLKLWLIISAVLLGGCYNVSTVYDNPNLYTVTATSSDEVLANNLVMNKAVRICDHSRYKVEVLEHTSAYQGMSNEEKSLVATASKAIGSSSNTTSDRDYKAILHFRCKIITVKDL